MSRIRLLIAVVLAQGLKAAAFSTAEKLSAPHCAQFGIAVDAGDSAWRAVANTALQCQRACAASGQSAEGSLSLFSGALSDGQPCENFTFHSDTKLCYLNPGVSEVKSKSTPHAISGPKDCPPAMGSELPKNTEPSMLFIPGAAHFNGQSELFEAAVQASQFAARRAVEEAKDISTSKSLKSMAGPGGQQSFAALDLDHNGILDVHEFQTASKESVELSPLFEKVDLNKDSKIDLAEWKQAIDPPARSLDEIVSLAAGAARDLALKGGLHYVQREICAAAAAAAAGMEEQRLQGEDLQAQTLAAVDAVAPDLPKEPAVALRCVAASFSAGLAVAGANSSIEAARKAAWKAMLQSEWNETRRQETAAQVAGLAAGLHAQAKHSHPYVIRKAVEDAIFRGAADERKRGLVEQIVRALETGWKVEDAKSIKDPVAANLVWVGEAFHQAFQATVAHQDPSEAAQRATDFLNQGDLPSHWTQLQEAAEEAQETQLRQGASVVEQAAAAASAVKEEAKKLKKSSKEEERLVLGAVAGAVRLGAPEAKSEELAGLVQKAAEKAGFSELAQAEAAAWASATADSPEATTGELSAETAAAVEPLLPVKSQALRGVQTAAASVAIDGSWHSKNDLGDLMKSEESFEKEMSSRLGREDLMHDADEPEGGRFRWPLWLTILAASLCGCGMVLGLLTWKQKKPKKSQRIASLEINYQEVQEALNCKDCEIGSETAPSPVASLHAASPMSSQLDIPQGKLSAFGLAGRSESLAASPRSSGDSPVASPGAGMASPTSMASLDVTATATAASPRSTMTPALTQEMLPPPEQVRGPQPQSFHLQPQQPGPLLISYPDWQQSYQPGEQREVNYQVPPRARPGSTLLVDVGNGLAVPTIVPESAYAGLTLTLRR